MKSSIFSKIGALLVCSILATASPIAGALDQLMNTRPFVATQDYQEQKFEGWVVYVNKELLNSRKDLGSPALSLLAQKLREIRKLVPSTALAKIMRVPIWLGVNDYAIPNPTYHQSASWLSDHGWNPDKAMSVEIGSAKTFIDWSPSQPMMVLHEFAHSYHQLVLGEDNIDLLNAFEQARVSGKYESVLRNGKLERAYALKNVHEFFAEATEAYFGRNDYYPTTREELRVFDPRTYEIIEKVWGVDRNKTAASTAESNIRNEQQVKISCSQRSLLKSISSASSAKVKFNNFTSALVRIYWINYEGGLVFYKDLQAGDSIVMQTFLTHPWRVERPDGKCITLVVPRSLDDVVTIGSND